MNRTSKSNSSTIDWVIARRANNATTDTFTDTRHNFSTDTHNPSEQERKTTRVIILNIPKDKTSLQVIGANNQKHEKQTETKSVK